jgi:hypothetical protein
MNHSSIRYISSLLDSPHTIAEGDKGSIGTFVQTYPYFVPARYLTALDGHKKSSFSPGVLTSIEPYMGNWILFCDFLDAGISGQKPWNSEHVKVRAEQTPDTTYQAWKESIAEPVATAEPATAEAAIEDAPVIIEVPADKTPDFTEAALVEEFVFNKDTIIGEPTYIEVIAEEITEEEPPKTEATTDEPALPINTNDYFSQQGEQVPVDIPVGIEQLKVSKVEAETSLEEPASTEALADEPTSAEATADEHDKTLMVMMSFSEWLAHFKNTSEKQEEETKDQKALRTMWQKEKLAAALEEENDEIPENVFEMAVNSIASEDGLASETLADIYIKQGKYDKAIEMYRKLSLRNPQKSAYFARKIEEVLKDKQS